MTGGAGAPPGTEAGPPVWPAPPGGPGTFRSVAREAEVTLEIRRSRFIARVAPVAGREAAEAWLEAARARHPRATHNVPAFIAGFRGEWRWCSDAGEPAGTAGKPALEVLERAGLVQVAVLITRYFGGVKLGAPGLVRAYAGACTAAIEAAGIVTFHRGRRGRLELPYPAYGAVRAWLEERGVAVLGETYAAGVTLELWVPEELEAEVPRQAAERSAGRAAWHPEGWEYRAAGTPMASGS
ncbi:IMPACT family protein [Thermaerobacter litoralis]